MTAPARTLDRRALLRDLSACTGVALAFPYANIVRAASVPLEVARLGGGLVALLGAESNAVAADAGDGLLLVDGADANSADALLQTVQREFAGKPIAALLNTHWHHEHTGANATVGARGGEIAAHENTAAWLGTEVWVRWSDRHYPALPKTGQPTRTFYDSGPQRFGQREVDCVYLPKSHTDGDVAVLFREENVLVTGGTISNDGWPVLDWWTGGWTGGLLDALDSLVKVANERTRIVPGNGPLMSYADLLAQREMFGVVIDRIHKGLRSAWSTEELLASRPTAEYDARWGDPTQFVTLAFHGTWRHLRDAHDTRMNNIA